MTYRYNIISIVIPLCLLTIVSQIFNDNRFLDRYKIQLKSSLLQLSRNIATNDTIVAAGITEEIKQAAVTPHNNTTVEYSSFFYVHVPKTGTSLYTVLRNRLSSCNVKDFTCFGIFGGGIFEQHAKDGRKHFPFSAESLGINDTREETCGNTLNCNPDKYYHCEYKMEWCRQQQNKVTMLRDPQYWFKSMFEWMWMYIMSQTNKVKNGFNVGKVGSPPMTFVTGKSNTNETEEAFKILQSEYLWWGITDYWNASVCLFHCELGGVSRASETINYRGDANSYKKNATEMEGKLSRKYHRSSYVANYTEYVEENYQGEIMFYHEKVLPEFRRRALACSCTL